MLMGDTKIVWRQTGEPLWSRVILVGQTNSATVLLSKDNVQMGIRAVGSNGFKSPVAFPCTERLQSTYFT